MLHVGGFRDVCGVFDETSGPKRSERPSGASSVEHLGDAATGSVAEATQDLREARREVLENEEQAGERRVAVFGVDVGILGGAKGGVLTESDSVKNEVTWNSGVTH